MLPYSKESDIQFQLHFLDCQPDSVIRSLNDKSVIEHLYRAATNQIVKFDKSYKRKESNRVTDIDQLSLILSPDLSIPTNTTTHLSIEITKTENRKISIPIVKSTTRTPSSSSIEIKIEKDNHIPKAPPLPPSLDLAIKLQSQSLKPAVVSPDRETLWAHIENQNVADYFERLINPIDSQNLRKTNESKNKSILDSRKTYNLGS